MASIIRIKRSSGILAPATLKTAELAYAYGNGTYQNQGDRLFVGKGDDGTGQATQIVTIGGSYFTDMLDHNPGLLRTNSAIIVDSDKKIEELKSGNIHIDGFNDKITGLVSPTDSSGAATKKYVDSAIGLIPSAVFTFTGDSGSDTVTLTDSGLNFQGQPGEIHARVTDNNLLISLDSSGVTAGIYGGATSIPIITVDDFGRVDSVGTSPLSTTLMVSADSGTADSVDLINDTLNFSGSNSIVTSVTDGNIDIRLDSTHQTTHLASYGAVYPGLYTYGGGSSLPRVSVDNFGIVKHIDQTNILAEITLRDEPSGSTETLFTSQNDLVITGGAGVNVNLTKNAYNGPATFEISVDSGGAVTADSGRFTALYLGVDSGRDWTWGLPGGESYYQRSPTLHQAGDAVLGLSYDGSNYGNVQLFDSSGGNLFMGPQTPNANPVYGEAYGKVWGHWQARNPNFNLGTIARPWRGTAFTHNIDFTEENSMIRIRNERDSSFQITTRTNLVSYPTTYTMVNYNTLDSQIEYYIDQRVEKDRFIYFGDSPSHGLIGKESTDNWLVLSNGGTGISLTSSNIWLNSTANAGFKQISVMGDIKPRYSPGELFDIGDSLGLVPATNYYTFKDGYFSDTLYADSFERTGVSVDSGVYGSTSAIPVFTVNRSGLIDSISTVSVSGVDSVGWLAHERYPGNPQNYQIIGSSTLEILTGDGTIHSAPIKYFRDSANFQEVIRPHGGIRMGLTANIEFGNTTVYGPSATQEYNGPSGSTLLERNTSNGSFGHKKGFQIYDDDGIRLHTNNLWFQTYDRGYGSGHDSTASNSSGNIFLGGHLVAKPTHPAYGPYDIGEDSSYTWRNAYFTGRVKANEIQLTSGGKVVADSGTFATLTLSELITDNIKIDGNTISSTDSSNQIFIDPFPTGDSGDLVVRGNLIVQGTETVVNSTVVSLNDKNLVLADSAATAAVADGAGLTVGGDQFDSTATKPQFVFDAATYRWDPNLPIDIPFVSLDSAVFLNGIALREVIEDHLDNFFGVDSNNAVTITYDDAANTMTWKGTDATTSQKGVSSFDSSNFTITAGHVAVTVLDGGTW